MFALNSTLSDFIFPVVAFCLFVYVWHIFSTLGFLLKLEPFYQPCLIWDFIPFMLTVTVDIFAPASAILFLFGP